MNNCPNEEELACYFDGLLPESEVKQLEKHLFEYDRCREIAEVTRKVIEEIK